MRDSHSRLIIPIFSQIKFGALFDRIISISSSSRLVVGHQYVSRPRAEKQFVLQFSQGTTPRSHGLMLVEAGDLNLCEQRIQRKTRHITWHPSPKQSYIKYVLTNLSCHWNLTSIIQVPFSMGHLTKAEIREAASRDHLPTQHAEKIWESASQQGVAGNTRGKGE